MRYVAIQITRQYSRSPIQYSNRASSTTHILLWSAVIANVFNFLYFWDLETDNSGTAEFLLLIIVLNYLLMRVHSGCARNFGIRPLLMRVHSGCFGGPVSLVYLFCHFLLFS